jgi:hypothetical protein
VAGGSVHNCPSVFVIAHELRVGDLPGEVVHDSQIYIGGVTFGLNIAGDGFALGAGVARFADEQVVSANRAVQPGQLGGGHTVAGEVRKVRVRGGGNVLATLGGLHIAPTHQVAHGKIHGRGEGVVFGFDGIGVDGLGDGQRGGAHGLSRGLFVLRDAANVLCLTL